MWQFPNESDKAIYEEAISSPVREFGVRMTVRYSNGTERVVDMSKIVGSNLSFSFQATNANTFNLGSAAIDTVNISTALDAPLVSGAQAGVTQFFLEAGYGLTKDDIKYVPIGIYRMQSKACSKKEGCYKLSLQSFMAALDKNLPKVFSLSGTVAQILKLICTQVRIRSVANPDEVRYLYFSEKMTDDYLSKLPNSTVQFKITEDTGYSTYRDIVKDLAVVSCCFATFDTDGGLLFVPFKQQGSTGVARSFTKDALVSTSENMEKFNIKEVRCVLVKDDGETSEEVDYGYPTGEDYAEYYDISGLKLFNTIDPIERANGIALMIYNNISSERDYTPTPFDISAVCTDFRLRLGDWITTTDFYGDTYSGQLMKISYNIPGKCTYASYQAPSNNDANATKRSSYTDNQSKPSSGGGTTVVTVDQLGQFHFNT